MNLRTEDFDFSLPPHLIAQHPSARRDASRLMVLDRATGSIAHSRFHELSEYFRPGDLLVANRTKVVPSRLVAERPTGGRVELLLLKRTGEREWLCMARPSRKLRPGVELRVPDSSLVATPLVAQGEGRWLVSFEGDDDLESSLRRHASLALPPYIRSVQSSDDRYQTVYADQDGSIAAPTAGLHFTQELLDELAARGVGRALVTLHVGPGTFKPVTAESVAEHRMEAEWGEVPDETADVINRTGANGGRVVAVGTTTTRLLESAAGDEGLRPFRGETDRFIYPGYRFRAIDALITNFHLPRSTLLMLVSALAGREFVLEAYREAVRHEYRFYSFGDAMLIL